MSRNFADNDVPLEVRERERRCAKGNCGQLTHELMWLPGSSITRSPSLGENGHKSVANGRRACMGRACAGRHRRRSSVSRASGAGSNAAARRDRCGFRGCINEEARPDELLHATLVEARHATEAERTAEEAAKAEAEARRAAEEESAQGERRTTEKSPRVSGAARGEKIPQSIFPKEPKKARLVIVGGGPVGLISSLLLLEYGRRRHVRFHIHVYDTRWIKNEDGHVRWCNRQERNNRRQQVVTIQSNVWSRLPLNVQEELFKDKDNFTEMWPLGPDSPGEVGYPRNIPVRVVEDKLLELLQREGSDTNEAGGGSVSEYFQPKPILCAGRENGRFNKEKMSQLDELDFIILADGAASRTEKDLFPSAFGSRVPFPEDPDLQLKDTVLGIYCRADDNDHGSFGLSESESMAMTVSQNRFLLNPLGRRMGFLNMWLTDEEAEQVYGIVPNTLEKNPCVQSQPCMFVRSDTGYSCETRGTLFAPSIPAFRDRFPLWSRILDGLKLFGIPEPCVQGFTLFHLGPFSQRTSFVAELDEPNCGRVNPSYGFVIGDAAFPVSFRAGRGLNTGVKGAISLARTLTDAAERGSWRHSDFLGHSAFMYGMQEREVRIRSLGMMRVKASDGTTYIPVKEKMKQGIELQQEGCRADFEKRVMTVARRTFTKERLPEGIAAPDEEKLREVLASVNNETISTLFSSGAWNVQPVGGKECIPDGDLFTQARSAAKEEAVLARRVAKAEAEARRAAKEEAAQAKNTAEAEVEARRAAEEEAAQARSAVEKMSRRSRESTCSKCMQMTHEVTLSSSGSFTKTPVTMSVNGTTTVFVGRCLRCDPFPDGFNLSQLDLVPSSIASKVQQLAATATSEEARHALEGLRVAARNSAKAAVDIAQAGGILLVLSSMRHHKGSSAVQEHACAALANLSYKNAANSVAIANAGGIQTVISAMKHHVSSAAVQVQACTALANLSHKNDTNRVDIGRAGGIANVVLAMRLYNTSAKVQQMACGALVNLSYSAPNLLLIRQENPRRLLEDARRSFWSECGVDASFVLRKLC